MDRRSRTLPGSAPDRVAAAHMDQAAGLQDLMVTDLKSLVAQLIAEEPVAELRIITMRVEDRVRGMRIGPFPLTDRGSEPLVVGLAGEPQDPARELHRYPVAGQVRHDGERHFGDWPSFRFACER